MFDIHLYNYQGLPNVVDKELPEPITVHGMFYTATDVLYPTIKIQRVPQTFNYVHIPKLNRFYFVDGITLVDNFFTTVKLTVDVLTSYKDKIIGAVGTSIRSEEPNYVNNNTPVYDMQPNTQKIEFADMLNHEGNIIMVTIKGK